MPFPDGKIDVVNNPTLKTPFFQDWDMEVNFPPPGTEFRITNASESRVTNNGDHRITNT